MQAEAIAHLIDEQLATKRDLKEVETTLRRDIKELEMRLMIKLGTMVVLALGTFSIWMKLL